MDILATFIWAGGAVAAEEIYRAQGRGLVAALARGLVWPFALGSALACIACGGEVRVTLQDGDHG